MLAQFYRHNALAAYIANSASNNLHPDISQDDSACLCELQSASAHEHAAH